jgi:hypothetical protein
MSIRKIIDWAIQDQKSEMKGNIASPFYQYQDYAGSWVWACDVDLGGGEDNVLERLQPGKIFDVISGPTCDTSNTWRWWLVKAASGTEGWMAEGIVDEYWLEPIA